MKCHETSNASDCHVRLVVPLALEIPLLTLTILAPAPLLDGLIDLILFGRKAIPPAEIKSKHCVPSLALNGDGISV
jgi:hypothetical protein